ncbi:unnamed protein product [Somion occarium]|uniref:C3H1-type domain-containing protein n=1 Tax=Somion occarium TaxID=3059160 RepID=A0ABP1E8J0_9APHY
MAVRRTKLCRNYALGHCPQGDQCKYIHSDYIPLNPTFSMIHQSPPMLGVHNSFSPNSPFSLSAPAMPWGLPSPTAAVPQGYPYNWNYQMTPTMPTFNAARPPQFRPLSWRTTLCRHFIKNQGWCPLGEDCGYIHDLQLAAHAQNDIRYPDRSQSHRATKGMSNGKNGSKQSHCWAYVQGMCRVKDCPYLHPASMELFIPHTPCLAWPNCSKGPMCRFKHPEPLIPRIPGFSTQASVSQQAQPTSPVQPIPPGTVQVHGTTYFPVAQEGSAPQPPLPSTGPQRSPQFPLHYSPTAASVPSGYSPYSNASLSFRSPVYESRQVVPMVSVASTSSEDANRYAGMRPPIPSGDVKVDDTPTKDATGLDEFPYRPPVHQRSGHARRVSVTLKSKEDSDALGLTNHGTTRRQSWMTHSKRDAETHRSWPWAPDAMGLPSTASSHKSVFGF